MAIKKNRDVLVLTSEDITERMLNGFTIEIPAGCTRLMVREAIRWNSTRPWVSMTTPGMGIPTVFELGFSLTQTRIA